MILRQDEEHRGSFFPSHVASLCVCVLDFSKEGSLAAVAASSDTHHFRFLVNFYLYFPLPNEVAAGRSNV